MKNYETFFEDLWDEVSPQLVSDDIWYKDEPKFQELTFELYRLYQSTTITSPLGEAIPLLPDKIFARIIESFFKQFKDKFE